MRGIVLPLVRKKDHKVHQLICFKAYFRMSQGQFGSLLSVVGFSINLNGQCKRNANYIKCISTLKVLLTGEIPGAPAKKKKRKCKVHREEKCEAFSIAKEASKTLHFKKLLQKATQAAKKLFCLNGA